MNRPSFFSSVPLFLGLLLVYGGERIADAGTPRLVTTSLGLCAVVAAIALRFWRVRAAKGERRDVERMMLWLCLVAACALALYFAQSDVSTRLGWRSLSQLAPTLAGALAALYPALRAGAMDPTDALRSL